MYINKVMLYGRLGGEPEMKSLPNGTSVVNFSLATTRSWKDKDGNKQEQTEWHRCVCFGKRAEVIQQYVHKGENFYMEGRIQTRSWEKDGIKRYSTEIMIEDFKFGDNPKKDGASTHTETAGKPAPTPSTTGGDSLGGIEYPDEDINPEDIPF